MSSTARATQVCGGKREGVVVVVLVVVVVVLAWQGIQLVVTTK